MFHDWHQFHVDEATSPAVVDSRRRMRICTAGFMALLVVILARAVHIEVTQGAAFRAEAVKPLRKEKSLPGVRGRILARDGTVLARDQKVHAVAVHYRHLQEPLDESARRLATLCGLTDQQYEHRARRIQRRVERIAAAVSRRLGKQTVVAEQVRAHVIADAVGPEVVARIEAHPPQYPGVTVIEHTRRTYPLGSMAAHVLGHVGAVNEDELAGPPDLSAYRPDDVVGRMGLEKHYETLLRGRRGVGVELTDHGGKTVSSFFDPEPGAGADLVLTLDPPLQRVAESLLDAALRRRNVHGEHAQQAGGAIVVMDVENGALLAAASAPRFDPNLFAGGGSNELDGVTWSDTVLADVRRPLFDRVCRMAIPPGSVFKVVSAIALLESAGVEPRHPFHCQGYLHQPDRQRCAIFRHQGVGHGDVTLGDALAQSCNVYFFHHVGEMGPEPLVDWSFRLGFGRPTAVDLPAEAAGNVPNPATAGQAARRPWRPGETESLAIGQAALCVTPLQVVRMTAAVANGGRLVTPHLVGRLGPPPQPIPGLSPETLATVREGLRRVVADVEGTAHATVHLDTIAVAGKTGTAETGVPDADHAWFAGYLPAIRPRFALVVVLEHAGDAATAAGPVAKRLVMQMQALGLVEWETTQHE